jgi:predicted Zn-dependent protease with MMP-like domain
VPLTQRTTNYAGFLPDRITIYRLPIISRCRDLNDVVESVRHTVIHEVAHHFGISDERLHELGAY